MKKIAAVLFLFCAAPSFSEEVKSWSGPMDGPAKAGQQVIESSAAWKDLWQTLGQEAPEVDFSRHRAVALFMGSKPTGGYSISVSKIEKKKRKIIVYVKEKTPSQGGMVIQAFTSPYYIRLLERSKLPISFKKDKS